MHQVDLDAGAGAAAHFTGRTGQAGCAHILNADDGAGLHGFQAGFEQQFLHEGIADLNIRPLLLRLFGELGGGHGCAMNAVAPGLSANVNDRIADARGFPVEDLVVLEHAEREHVNQRVAVVAILKNALAADGRHAEAVSVMRDPGHNAFEDAAVARARFCGSSSAPESQRVKHRDRPCAHRENIAKNAADACRRALKRLDETGMIVRFDLERDR